MENDVAVGSSEEQYDQLVQDSYDAALERESSVLKIQLDVEKFYEHLEHELKAEKFVKLKDGKRVDRWERDPNRRRILNEAGVNAVMSIVKTYITQDTFLSNLTKNDINAILRSIGYNIVDLVVQFPTEYEIDERDLDLVCDIIFNKCQIALSRAKEGKTLDLLNKKFEQKEIRTLDASENHKRGLLG